MCCASQSLRAGEPDPLYFPRHFNVHAKRQLCLQSFLPAVLRKEEPGEVHEINAAHAGDAGCVLTLRGMSNPTLSMLCDVFMALQALPLVKYSISMIKVRSSCSFVVGTTVRFSIIEILKAFGSLEARPWIRPVSGMIQPYMQ